MTYQLQANSILRVADNAFIPVDPGNTDYQEFLAWEAEGNTPLPADPLVESVLLPDWSGFYNSLLVSSCFATARIAATQNLIANVAYTDCATSLGLATQGNENISAIQTSINSLIEAVSFNQSDRDELSDLITQHHIPITYV